MIMPAVKIVSARSVIVKVHECLCLAMTCRCPFLVDSHATVVNVLDFVAHCLLCVFARFDTCHKRCREITPQYRAFDSGRRSSSSLLCGIVRSLRTSSSRSIHSDILSTSFSSCVLCTDVCWIDLSWQSPLGKYLLLPSAVSTYTWFPNVSDPIHLLGLRFGCSAPSPLSVSTRMMTTQLLTIR